jgi:hypothetical protein
MKLAMPPERGVSDEHAYSVLLSPWRTSSVNLATLGSSIFLIVDVVGGSGKVSSCQVVKLSSCQVVKLSNCQVVKLSTTREEMME